VRGESIYATLYIYGNPTIRPTICSAVPVARTRLNANQFVCYSSATTESGAY
jgi:hypothetical protein